MARNQARILVEIWDDEDFISLPPLVQRLYLFLLSQSDLNHAGLLALRTKRWAAKVPGGSVESLRADLATLEQRRYVVVDEDREELLVRTLVRNDRVYKQPKVMVRMGEDARQIGSQKLRRVFLAELDRLPLDELKDETRVEVDKVIEALKVTLAPRLDTHPDTHPGTPPDVTGDPSSRARTRIRLPPSTFHHPSSGEGDAALPLTPTPGTETNDQRAKRLAKVHYDRQPMSKFLATVSVVKAAMKAKKSDAEITEALVRMADEGRSVTVDALRVEIEGFPAQRPRAGPRQSTGQQRIGDADAALARIKSQLANPEQHQIGGAA